MGGNYLYTALFEDAANRRPGVTGLDEVTPGGAQLCAASGIP
jgi:hypothetical protein